MAQREEIQDLLGRTWCDRYQILEYLGRGGMGAVFKARQIHMDREVALKVIHRKLCQDDKQVQRFEQEARTSSKLNHPNSIRVFDYGKSEDGRLFMAMEFLRGRTLGRLIADEGPLEPKRVIAVARQMFKSLAEAHQLGLVHRDLKPENIFICEIFGETDYVKVLDFGIAKAIGPTADEANLTQTGFICGTPRYLSPEQALGQKVDGRADLYSVGVLMYEMLTGRPPFVGENPISIVMKHVHDDPPPLVGLDRFGEDGRKLEWLVERLLEKNPARRPSPSERIVKYLDGSVTQAELLGRAPTVDKKRSATAQLNRVTRGEAHSGRSSSASSPEMRSYEFRDMGQGGQDPTSQGSREDAEVYRPPPLPPEASIPALSVESVRAHVAGALAGGVNNAAETAMIPSGLVRQGLDADVPSPDETALIARPVGLVHTSDTRPGETMMLEKEKATRLMSRQDIGEQMVRRSEEVEGPARIRRPQTAPGVPLVTPPPRSKKAAPPGTRERKKAPAGLVTDVTPAPRATRATSPMWAWVLAGVAIAVMLLGAFTLWWSGRGGPEPRAVAAAQAADSERFDRVEVDEDERPTASTERKKAAAKKREAADKRKADRRAAAAERAEAERVEAAAAKKAASSAAGLVPAPAAGEKADVAPAEPPEAAPGTAVAVPATEEPAPAVVGDVPARTAEAVPQPEPPTEAGSMIGKVLVQIRLPAEAPAVAEAAPAPKKPVARAKKKRASKAPHADRHQIGRSKAKKTSRSTAARKSSATRTKKKASEPKKKPAKKMKVDFEVF